MFSTTTSRRSKRREVNEEHGATPYITYMNTLHYIAMWYTVQARNLHFYFVYCIICNFVQLLPRKQGEGYLVVLAGNAWILHIFILNFCQVLDDDIRSTSHDIGEIPTFEKRNKSKIRGRNPRVIFVENFITNTNRYQ